MTVREALTSSLRLIGAILPREVPDDDELQDALLIANNMLETWRLDALLVPNETRETFTLTANQDPHTIGDGGDFDTTQPIKILRAGIIDTSQDPAYERPVEIIWNPARYAAIRQKAFESEFPDWLFFRRESAAGLGSIYLYPAPSTAHDIALYMWAVLASLATLDTTFAMPVGYARAFRYNLALDLAPEWGLEVQPRVERIAESALDAIRTNNVTLPELQCEYTRGRGGDDRWWLTGE